jgi:hypothetical protein
LLTFGFSRRTEGVATFDLNGDGRADVHLAAQPSTDTLGLDFVSGLPGSQPFRMGTVPSGHHLGAYLSGSCRTAASITWSREFVAENGLFPATSATGVPLRHQGLGTLLRRRNIRVLCDIS